MICVESSAEGISAERGVLMDVFFTSLNEMLMVFVFIFAGWILKRKHILPENSGSVLSKLESNILLPALIINTFMTRCSLKNLADKSTLLIYCVIIFIPITIIAFWVGKRFSAKPFHQRLYRHAFIVSNYGFMGNALVLGIFGEDALFNYMMFTIPLNILTFSLCVSWLMPNGDGKFSLKSLCNPICIALLIGIVLGITQIPVPDFIQTVISSTASCMFPIAMLLTGFIVGGYGVRKLMSMPKVYVISLLRLVVIPAIVTILLKLLHTSDDVILVALCALAMPIGMNVIIFPAAYGRDTNVGASMVLVSHVLALITIPVMFTIFL